jgi:hypothetical protein
MTTKQIGRHICPNCLNRVEAAGCSTKVHMQQYTAGENAMGY